MKAAAASGQDLLVASTELLLLVEGDARRIVAASPEAEQRLGYDVGALSGMHLDELECALADLFFWDEMRGATGARQAESAYRCADGTVLEVIKTVRQVCAEPLRYAIHAAPAAAAQQALASLAEADSRLRATLEATADGILLLDCQGAILSMNRRFSALWRIPEALLVSHDDAGILSWLQAQCRDEPGVQAVPDPRADAEERFTVLHLRDGRVFECSAHVARTRQGTIGCVYSYRDVSEREESRLRLVRAASVFSHAREGIMITAPDSTIIDINEAFTRITGYGRREVIGQPARMLSSGRQGQEFYTAMWRDITQLGHWSGEIWNRRKNGEVYAEMLTISTVRAPDGAIECYVALFSDITPLKEQQHHLERIAHYDALTGLPNRVLFSDRLHQAMTRARRQAKRLAVAYLDLDGFKAVNDGHGHETGDELLIAVANQVRQALREGDTIARLGGDEFVIVLGDLEAGDDCTVVLQRVLTAAATPVAVHHLLLKVSASLGVTFYPQADEVDADHLLRQADQAMYQAKVTGKNRFHFFDPALDRAAKGRHESIECLRGALARGEFVLHYQPKVNLRQGKVLGAEALIRWQHPERGLLAPAAFLPAVENHPLSIEIGQWVIATALAQLDAWQAAGLDLGVSVNVGAYELQQHDFVHCLRLQLREYPQLDPGRLQLEILESSALEDIEQVSTIMVACQQLGVSFALDDFGTGYSSLTYLKRLPLSEIKVDQSFVRDMLDDPDDLAILDGVNGLTTAFGRELIAEGVETPEHIELLLRLGYARMQGYGIAWPMPAFAFADWVGSWQPDPAWEKIPVVSRRQLPVLFAGVDLRAWLQALGEYLNGVRMQPPPLAQTACRFQRWLESPDGRSYAHLPVHAEIETLHASLHTRAQLLHAAFGNGDRAGALAGLSELEGLRDALLVALRRLLHSAAD